MPISKEQEEQAKRCHDLAVRLEQADKWEYARKELVDFFEEEAKRLRKAAKT